MVVSLELAREHCNITDEVSDALLQLYVNAAEARVAAYLNRPLADLSNATPPRVDDPEAFAAAIQLGILLYTADPVAQRETIVVGTITSSLPTAESILYPYRIGLGV